MNRLFKKINLQLILLIILTIITQQDAHSQESTFVSAVIKDAGGDVQKLDKIISEHENLLNQYPNGEFAPTIMFQLAELYEQKSTLEFQHAMEQYEKALEQFDKGELDQEPTMPNMSLAKSLEYCNKVRDQFPGIDFQDKVVYKIAMAHLKQGDPLNAKIYFEEIISNFPDSPINLESHFRIGEFFFDKRDYKTAISHYKNLLDRWDNSYFDMSLYKLGWSYYNINDYANSISTFLYLIEDISLIERVDSQILAKSTTDLRTEAIHYIASCFAEYGGPKLAQQFLDSKKDRDYTEAIFLKIGELYQKRNYYDEAIETYKVLLDVYPLYKDAPEMYRRMIENYELDGNLTKANELREEMVINLGPSGPWLTQYSYGDEFEAGKKASRDALVYLGKHYQSEAQSRGQVRDFHLAINKYQEFLDKFPDDPEAHRINFYMAEAYYGVGNYSQAAESYFDVVTKYDSSEYKQDSAYNRILCYYQLIGNDQPMDSVTIYVDEFLGSPEILTVKLDRNSEIDFIRASNDFCLLFASSKWFDQVLMKFGEVLHELKAFVPAVKAYKKVLELGPNRPYYLSAAMNAGQSYFDGEYYEEADLWFSNLTKNYPESTQYIEKAQKLAASSKFKIAEKLSINGEAAKAASLLNVVASNSDDPKFQERALFESANQYQKSGDMVRAALALEQLANNHKSSELADEALYRAAGLREGLEDWSLAAANYLKISQNYPSSQYATRSLKNAAICYENKGDWTTAKVVYNRFVEKHPSEFDDVIECKYKSGEMSFKANLAIEARYDFLQVLTLHRTYLEANQFVDNYYVANAQFMLGELEFEEYKKLEIKPPLNVNLKLKVAKFQKVFQAYKNALEFQVADWSTAASYKIGMAFEEFVRAFMESPAPPGLDEEDLSKYMAGITKQTRPYKERAYATYKKNVEQADVNKISNSWIIQSRNRMAVLAEELASDTENSKKGS